MSDATLTPWLTLREAVTARCCGTVLPAGSQVRLYQQPSPDRVLVVSSVEGSGIHKLKRSTWRRVTGQV